ncbi:DNA internalization-related competence protein ComEC/Rec2 [Zhongshania aliphaticivorans]|uniref:DNA internalization-related competence protein ComEC/Rec2 n=1 Tax=Zhongshania aliphaticivorans TaxID=1470434 RepID=UPI0012E4A3BF|nr:DNA internalization-related competence protein ComEC/Rec2 [Zhongshania aliphaticivorans]CAA0108465.1 ComE operon protein 3 [Zhongshania aliphaticivorans]
MLSWMTAAIVGFFAIAFAPALPSYILLVSMLGLAFSLYLSWRSPYSRAILAFVLALIYAGLYGHWRVALLLPTHLSGSDFLATVEVRTAPEERSGFSRYYRFDANVSALSCTNEVLSNYCDPSLSFLNHRLIQLNWYADSPPELGQVFTATLRLRQPHGYQSPGAFDYGRWMFASGYSANGHVLNPGQVEYLGQESSLSFNNFRQQLITGLSDRLATYQHGSIMRALLFADRDGIDREQWQVFSRTGTSHLMAISGMHIGIVLAWGFLLGRGVGLLLPGGNSLFTGAGIALVFAFIYAALAGFSVPTQRALIMAAVALLAFCFRRNNSMWQAYATAMLLVLSVDPLAPHRAGFSLSFAAVGVLLFAFQGRRHGHAVWGVFQSQWVVLLGLIPLLMMWGYGLSPVSFPVNLIAIPLVTLLVLPLLFCGLILIGVAPSLANMSWHAADLLIDVLLRVLAWSAQLLPQIVIPSSLAVLLLASAAILLLMLPRGVPAKYLAAIPLLTIVFSPAPRPTLGSAWVTVLDVGQGLAVFVQTHSNALLYDVGPDFSSGFNTADAVVIPALRSFGVDRLGMLILSHADKDHAGAAPALLKQIDTDELVLGESVSNIVIPSSLCDSPRNWAWDGVQFEFLASDRGEFTGNNTSCVLKVSVGGASVLLTGDIETDIERQLLAGRHDLSAALLIAPHHGSNTSSSAEFISAVLPEYVVFSAGTDNHYGHPALKVMQRYDKIGARCWNTAYHGSIQFQITESSVVAQKNWGGRRYYWQSERNSSKSGHEICSNLHSGR